MDLTLIVAMAIVGVSGTIFGVTGFGFALVSVPPLLLLFEPATVVTITIGVSLATSVMLVAGSRQDIDGVVVLSLLPGALVGLFAGVQLLKLLDPDVITVVAGAIVVVYSLVLLTGVRPRGGDSIWAAVVAGAASGTLATSTGLSGPPIVMLFTARELAKNPFRVSMAAYFIVINLVGLIVLVVQDAVDASQLATTVALTPAGVLGTLAGTLIVRRVSSTHFRTLTLLLLLLTGVTGAITAVRAFV